MSTVIVTNEQELGNALTKIFQTDYGKGIATQISKRFLESCEENGYEWDLLVDEFKIDNIDDSLLIDIVCDVLNELNVKNDENDKNKLFKLLKTIKPVHDDINDVINPDKNSIKLNNYKDAVCKLFEKKYKKKNLAEQAIKAYEKFVNEGDYDYDGLVQVISGDSELVAAMDKALDFADSNDILIILKEAINEINSPSFNPEQIILSVDETDKQMARKDFRSLCPTIFVNEQNNVDKISDLAILKAIDIKNGNHGLLLLLWDTWTRYKIDNGIDNTLDVLDFWDNHYKFGKWLNLKYGDTKKQEIHNLKYGLHTFNKRVIRDINNKYILCDDISQFVYYTISSSQFIQNLTEQREEEKKESPATLPLSFDFWFIPQCAQKKKKEKHDDGDNEDYDSDDDDDDDDDDKKDDDENYCYLGYGGIDEQNKSPLNPIGDIGEYLSKCHYKIDTDFVSHRVNAVNYKDMRSSFLTLYNRMNKDKLTHQRFIFIVDRRDPKYYVRPSSLEERKKHENNYNFSDKTWDDIIYCIKPKQDKYYKIHTDYWQFPEVFLELSRNFILPTTRNNQSIGILNDLFGFMFNLSYHLYDGDIIRCYWSQNGKTQRFFKNDMKEIWPKYFEENNNKKQEFDKDLLDLFKPLKDEKFKIFYQETTTRNYKI